MTKRARAPSTDPGTTGTSLRERGASLARRLPASLVGRTVSALRRRWPGAVDATLVGAQRTTRAVQALPNSTIRSLAAGSAGLGAGLYLGGAPRLVAAAGIAPAIVMGAAVLSRPGRRDAATSQKDAAAAAAGGEDARLDDDGGHAVD